MYLIDRGWKHWEIEHVTISQALEIFGMLQEGVYGPMAGQTMAYSQLQYSHNLVMANVDKKKRSDIKPFKELSPTVWQYITGEEPAKKTDWRDRLRQQMKARSTDV